jgi:hypothetical protein
MLDSIPDYQKKEEEIDGERLQRTYEDYEELS